MAVIHTRVDTKELEELVSKMAAGRARKAIARGLNDAVRQGRTEARRAVTKRYNIPLKELARTGRASLMRANWASQRDLESQILADVEKSVKLARFSNTSGGGGTLKRTQHGSFLRRGKKTLGKPLTGSKKSKVRVKLLKGGRKKVVEGAFIAKTKSGHIGVFGRGKYDGSGAFKFAKKGGKMTELGAMTLFKALSSKKVEDTIKNKASSALGRRTKYWLEKELGLA